MHSRQGLRATEALIKRKESLKGEYGGEGKEDKIGET
ncbi:MAG: hypothetical protein K0S07_770 [Chlamydiales bacterium]|nr:hypothetical protein [Chlamydiales bacterium]